MHYQVNPTTIVDVISDLESRLRRLEYPRGPQVPISHQAITIDQLAGGTTNVRITGNVEVDEYWTGARVFTYNLKLQRLNSSIALGPSSYYDIGISLPADAIFSSRVTAEFAYDIAWLWSGTGNTTYAATIAITNTGNMSIKMNGTDSITWAAGAYAIVNHVIYDPAP